MRNQVKLICLVCLATLPSSVFAACPPPQVGNLTFDPSTSSVKWTKSATTLSCVKGYMVCWQQTAINTVTCDTEAASVGYLKLTDLAPCKPFKLNIRAFNYNGLTSTLFNATATAGLPQVSKMTVTQVSRNVTTMTWPSVSTYSCVQSIHFSLCENPTLTDYTGCWFTDLSPEYTGLVFRDLDVCKNYYVKISIVGRVAVNVIQYKTHIFAFYMDSSNVVTRLKGNNVKYNSADIEWWITNSNTTCSNERMELCFSDKAGSMASPACSKWRVAQRGFHNVTSLVGLDSCTTYKADVVLKTARSHSNLSLTFTTPLNPTALNAAVTNTTADSGSVAWSLKTPTTDCNPIYVKSCIYRKINSSTLAPGACKVITLKGTSGVTYSSLTACTAYRVSLTVMTTTSLRYSRNLDLITTTQGTSLLAGLNLTSSDKNILVSWSVLANTSLQCVKQYNVSWSAATSAASMGFSILNSSVTSYTISPVSTDNTYYVDVQAVFVQGNTQKLSGQVYVSGSSRHFSNLSTILSVLPIVLFVKLFEIS